jgi:hypothetical protein
MKTLEQRERELEEIENRPFALAKTLAENVRGYCERKRVFVVTANVDFNKVTISCSDTKLTVGSQADGSWTLESDGTIQKDLTDDQVLDAILKFIHQR